ncbi:hypothetical protein BX600DRAFT_121882 [Xylariales sp. PMI_506]|nr:hypothetical protein BX600DRAFT_121882 [Xylariales sp. PMI_506]
MPPAFALQLIVLPFLCPLLQWTRPLVVHCLALLHRAFSHHESLHERTPRPRPLPTNDGELRCDLAGPSHRPLPIDSAAVV